jgi:hypothetical protein
MYQPERFSVSAVMSNETPFTLVRLNQPGRFSINAVVSTEMVFTQCDYQPVRF